MPKEFKKTRLEGKFLIAMPNMGSQTFDKSVVLILYHSKTGTLGLIVNKDITMVSIEESDSKEGFEIKPGTSFHLHFGGPVEINRPIILHSKLSTDYEETFKAAENIYVTMSKDIIEDLCIGKFPNNILFAMGYSGWVPGQLEKEILENSWIISESNWELLYNDMECEEKWEAALLLNGINPSRLVSWGGHA